MACIILAFAVVILVLLRGVARTLKRRAAVRRTQEHMATLAGRYGPR